MNNFSLIDYTFQSFIDEHKINKEKEEKRRLLEPFAGNETLPEAVLNRIQKSLNSFWSFDKIYFSPELYSGYAKPNKMLKKIVEKSIVPGYHLFLGPRKHGKTITGKKLLIWLLLTNKIQIAGVYCETLNKSSNILKDIAGLILRNDRIMSDWKVEFSEANSDQIAFTVNLPYDFVSIAKQTRYVASFSEGRSLRGYTRLFGRPQFLLADDVETLESSFSRSAVQLRIDKLIESFHSLQDNSSFLILGNDIVLSSAMHQLRHQAEENLLPKEFNVYVYKAWNNKPLWKEKYKANTEAELKTLISPLNESDWQANYQLNPIPPEGFFFTREHYNEYDFIPKDSKGVLYCDPNLSKKGKGNTTAITALVYSPSNDLFYIQNAVCKSFSDANELLNSSFSLKKPNIYALAFDGNVTQESTWTQFVKNWCRINCAPIPHIEYKRYRVNDLAKNIQYAYSEGRILFPKNFSNSETGQQYLSQLFAFIGEKTSGIDDAPDSLICAFEFIHDRALVKRETFKPIVINDHYLI